MKKTSIRRAEASAQPLTPLTADDALTNLKRARQAILKRLADRIASGLAFSSEDRQDIDTLSRVQRLIKEFDARK